MMLRLFIFLIFFIFSSLVIANTSPPLESWYFPQQEISIGFYDNNVMPTQIPHPPHPIFWTSRTKVDVGLTFIYQWLKFHTDKYFSVHLAVSLSDWVIHSNSEVAASFFFVIRVWLFRTDPFSPYF